MDAVTHLLGISVNVKTRKCNFERVNDVFQLLIFKWLMDVCSGEF